jgi:hypothetical protein
VDFARAFPAETPNRNLRAGFLYNLLRPELIARFPVPLSSDSFTLFGEDNAEEHNQETIEATNFLHHKAPLPPFFFFLFLLSCMFCVCICKE